MGIGFELLVYYFIMVENCWKLVDIWLLFVIMQSYYLFVD